MSNKLLKRKIQTAQRYLFYDKFIQNQAAPLTTPRKCDSGLGSLAITDTNSIISTANGTLVINGIPALATDKIILSSALTRLCGRAFLWGFPIHGSPTTGGNPRMGLATTVNGTEDIGLDLSSSTTFRMKTSATPIDTVTFSSGRWDFACIMRGTGGFLFGRDGLTKGDYTLLWVYNTGTGDLTPNIFLQNATSLSCALDYVKGIDLGGKFLTDYGIAIARYTGSIASNLPILHNADAIIEYTFNEASANQDNLYYRYQDANNNFRLVARTTDGLCAVVRTVAGTPTTIASASSVFSTGITYRVVLIIRGQNHRVYVNDVLKLNFNDTNFVTQSNGLTNITSPGTMTEIISWPTTVNLGDI